MSKKDSNISFIIPAYNCEDTITETVESVFKGNYQKGDEVIIVNDGSKDGTKKVLKHLQNQYHLIKIIDNPRNLGCPASRNVGIGKARNKLIFNLDSDNVLAPKSITVLKEYLLKNKADAASFGEILFFTKKVNNVTHKWVFNKNNFILPDLFASHINPGPAGNFLYTKQIWKKVGKYWEYGKGLHEAWGFHLKLLASGAKYVILPNSYYYHRYGHKSLFVRESKNTNKGIRLTNKMVRPFLSLINIEDVNYMKKNDWFKNIENHPIRIRFHKIGYKGKKVIVKKTSKDKLTAVINNIFR
jgi:glycosyltransferase involved in cell wall biosynthesis